MKVIYLDSEFKCHVVETDETLISVETDVFDDKSDTFIEGYRFIPAGMTWIRSDGKVFEGEMASPWKDSTLLGTIQSLYEENLVNEERIAALEEESAMLKEESATLREENAMLTECVLEMSEVVYA